MKSPTTIGLMICLVMAQCLAFFPEKMHFSTSVENCKVFQDDKSKGCKTCKDGYYPKSVTEDSKTYTDCAACTSPCKTCSSATQCTGCHEGSFLDSHKCNKCPAGCKTCTSATKCQTCHEGYRPNSNVCEKCSDANCKKCEKDPKVCETCSTSYFVKDKKTCEKCSEHCIECTDGSHCTKCANGFHLNKNKCGKFNWWRWLWIGAIVCCLCVGIAAAIGMFLANKKKRGGYHKQEDDYEDYAPEGSSYSDHRGKNYDFDPGYDDAYAPYDAEGYDKYDNPQRGGDQYYNPQPDNYGDYELQKRRDPMYADGDYRGQGDFGDFDGSQRWDQGDQQYGYY